MTLATEIQKPVGTPVFLLETTAGRTIKFWEGQGAAGFGQDSTDISGCTLNFDARKETVYSNLDPVTVAHEWAGITGDFSAPGGREALYIASAQNGLPAYRFNGIGVGNIYIQSVADLSDVFSTGPFSMLCVFKWDGADQDGVNFFGGRYPDDTNRCPSLGIMGSLQGPINTIRADIDATAVAGLFPTNFQDNWHFMTVVFDGTTWTFFVDGYQVFNQMTLATFNNLVSGNLFWGGFADDFHFHFHGDQAVFSIFNKALSEGERLSLEYEVATAYGISGNIVNHLWVSPETRRVESVKHNGVELTERTSAVDVENNPGSWYWDRTNLYIRLANDEDPRAEDQTVVAYLHYNFSSVPKTFNGVPYEPILQNVPSLSLRIEKDFTGIVQTGGGESSFVNNSGFFDSLTDLDWDAGLTTIRMGFDRPQASVFMSYADYQIVGTWSNSAWKKDDRNFVLKLSELKEKIDRNIPFDYYTRDVYPELAEGDIGKGIQLAYGQIFGATPVVVSYSNKTFKVAGHRIFSLDAVRVARQNGWEDLPVTSQDLANGEFTCNDWDGESNLSVDFHGKAVDISGTIIYLSNPADILEDLLTLLGQTNLDTTSFSESRNKLFLGYREDGTEVHLRTPSIYLTGGERFFDVLEIINGVVGSYLFAGADGQWKYVVFEPQQGEGLSFFDKTSFLEPLFREENQEGKEVTQLIVEHSIRLSENWHETVFFEKLSNQYSKNEPVAVPFTTDLSVSSSDEALYWAQRNAIIKGRTLKLYFIQLNWKGFLIQPGQQIRIGYDRHNLDKVLEVMETKLDLTTAKMDLVLADLHAFRDTVGFWVDDLDVLPTRFATLAGYGSRVDGYPDGSLQWNKDWDPRIKTWARQNVGYWTDPNGFADPADPDSYIPSSWF